MDHLRRSSPEQPCRTECQHCSTHIQEYKIVLKREAKCRQQANLISNCTVATALATMTVHIIPTNTYHVFTVFAASSQICRKENCRTGMYKIT